VYRKRTYLAGVTGYKSLFIKKSENWGFFWGISGMLQNYLKTAIRSLMRNGLYSAINILGLSIGLACTMLIVLYVKDELSFDRFFTNSNRTYRILNQTMDPMGNVHRMGITGYFQGPHFAAKVPAIQSFVRVQHSYREIKTNNDVQPQQVALADFNFFAVFSLPFLHGDPKSCLLQPHSIVLTESLAKKQFGTTNVVGKTIQIKGHDIFTPYVVTGVTQDCPQNSSVQYEAMLPFHESPEEEAKGENWFGSFLTTYVLLAPNTDIKTVNEQIERTYKSDAGPAIRMIEQKYHFTDKTVYTLEPLKDMHLDTQMSADIANTSNSIYSYLLSGIAIFILLIACINFVNLTVARSLKRAKEIGVRKVVGGSRRQLMGQFMGESMLLALAAFLLALIEVQLTLPVFNHLANKSLALSYLLDARLVATFIGLYLVTGFLAGFYPALVLSGFDPAQTLYNRFMPAGKNYLQKGLVILQFTLASFVIIATTVMFSQFKYLTTEKLGYDDSNLIRMYKQNLTVGETELLRSELTKDPDFLDVSGKDAGYSFTGGTINGNQGTGFVYATIDPHYLPLLKIPVVKGRNFSDAYAMDTTNAVLVNETFVRNAGWTNPIGQVVLFGRDSTRLQVVGVVKDYHFEALNTEIKPQLFVMPSRGNLGDLYIRIRPKTEAASLAYLEKVFHRLYPLNPFSPTFMNETNLQHYESEARWKQILFFSAIITIFISCVGLFGLAVLSAERRVKEIGIRKVLGASVASVVRILSRDFLGLVLLSLVVAIPCAWMAAHKWLEIYPYRIRLGWELFAGPGVLVVLIAVMTVSSQALKAATANPVRSLRAE
jgi:putative ABC transport system permease protein